MLSKKSKLFKYYVYSLVVILLLFVLVFLSLDLVAPKIIKKVVRDYSESKDVNLSISNLEFDTKKGFVGKNLYLTDSGDLNKNHANSKNMVF